MAAIAGQGQSATVMLSTGSSSSGSTPESTVLEIKSDCSELERKEKYLTCVMNLKNEDFELFSCHVDATFFTKYMGIAEASGLIVMGMRPPSGDGFREIIFARPKVKVKTT